VAHVFFIVKLDPCVGPVKDFGHTVTNLLSMENRLPKLFISEETGRPFDACLVCGKYLLQEGTPYVIEKSYRNLEEFDSSELLFEYAICLACANKFSESLSEETKERITNYLSNSGISPLALSEGADLVEPMTCAIKRTPIRQSAEYQLIAHCNGTQLSSSLPPFAVGFAAMEEMAELLSDKSRDELDGFIGQHFSGPPDVAEILRRRPVLI